MLTLKLKRLMNISQIVLFNETFVSQIRYENFHEPEFKQCIHIKNKFGVLHLNLCQYNQTYYITKKKNKTC